MEIGHKRAFGNNKKRKVKKYKVPLSQHATGPSTSSVDLTINGESMIPLHHSLDINNQGFTEIMNELISLLPESNSIRGYLESTLKSIDYIDSIQLQRDITKFASAALGIKKYIGPLLANIRENVIFIGMQLVRGALSILSMVTGTHILIKFALSILDIGLAYFNTEQNIDIVMKNIIEQQRYDEMTNECEGAKLWFVNATIFLCGIGVRKLSANETSSLSAHVPMNIGVSLLGKLTSIIKKLQIQICQNKLNKRRNSKFKRLMKYIHMYCCLAMLHKSVLLQLYALLYISDNSPAIADGIKAVLDKQNAQDMSLLDFLTHPTKDNVILSFLFESTEHEIVNKFLGLEMKVNELKHLTEGEFVIRPLASPTQCLYMSEHIGMLELSEWAPYSQTKFRFHAKGKNTFAISVLKWPGYFIRIGFFGKLVYGSGGIPHEHAEFKIVPIQEKGNGGVCHLLATRALDTQLLCASSDGVYGIGCKPNDSSFWIIQKGFPKAIEKLISVHPQAATLREYFTKASMTFDDLHSSKLKEDVENFASAVIEIRMINASEVINNVTFGIKLIRSAFVILSLIKDKNPVTTCAYLILSIGMESLNMIGKTTVTMLVDMLEQQNEKELINECRSVKEGFVYAANVLCGFGIRQLTERDQSTALSVVLELGVDLLNRLNFIIHDLKNKTCLKYVDSRKYPEFERLMNLVKMYCILATLRKSVLLHVYALLNIIEEIPVWLGKVKTLLDEQYAKDTTLLKFLTKPQKENVILSFLFDPYNHLLVQNCLCVSEISDLKYLTKGEFVIRPYAYPTHFLYMADVPGSWILISERAVTTQTKFKFHAKKENTFTISSLKWPEYFIRMEMDGLWVAGNKTNHDKHEEFKIVRMEDEKTREISFVLATSGMNTKFLCAASVGRVCGDSCKPNDYHFWIIEKY